MRRDLVAGCLLTFSGMVSTAQAQVPAGGEFRANAYFTSEQKFATVSADERGNFVVIWRSYAQDGSSTGVFGQRYDASGARRGAEFRANTYTTGTQDQGVAAFDAAGGFVVVWTSQGQDGDSDGIFGRRYDASGAPRGGEFLVNAATTGLQEWPSVASDRAGNFVVVWRSSVGDGDTWGVFARRFDAAGAPVGDQFQVNTFTPGMQLSTRESIAMDAAGNFVVVWRNQPPSLSTSAFGQLFDATGARLGPEFRVNSYTPGAKGFPAVAMDATGNFVVAWSSQNQDGSGQGVFAQRYDATGVPRGAEFLVNTHTTDYQWQPSIASDAGGNFIVTWESRAQDGSAEGVFAQRFASSGSRRGSEFRVNSYTTDTQAYPEVAADPVGNMLVVWDSRWQDGTFYSVFGQRFGGLTPAALAVDPAATPGSNGNGVIEPGESAAAKPYWRNVNGAAQTFGGVFSGIAGPAGMTYTIDDAIASYGTVANGATVTCPDCYVITVSNPPTRPQTHIDAAALETITPDALGQAKRWALHVGGSFADVAPSHPSYASIETLLHRGVTVGCRGGETSTFCPGALLTRGQMAPVVLLAREGAGYTPPACTAPSMFPDVPADDPFCPWIEELARRGAVAGCGPFGYCPTRAVTRQEFAVVLVKTLDAAVSPPPCVPPNIYPDVPETSPYCRWIEELARRGMVADCGGGNYCPTARVTRGDMAVFVTRTFALSLYGI